MATQTPTDLTGISRQQVSDFASTVRGPVIGADDPLYDDARRLQNGLVQRRPAMIVRCSGTADVVDTVNFARMNNLTLSIKGGGHNVGGNAMNDGGVVIDLSGMRSVQVDPVHRTVRAGGGATWGDVDRESQLFGLAVPGGVVSTTGVGGLTLHGGLGHLRRKHGLSIDNLLAVEIVTADGQVRTASESENADLFWAIRGAGSNFGVVTSFLFKAHEVGPMVHLCAPAYALRDATTVFRGWRDYIEHAPDEVSALVLMWNIPDAEAFPADVRRQPVIITPAVYAGTPEDGERVMHPLRELATPIIDLTHTEHYTALQASFDPFFPKGRLYYWKSTYIDELSDDAITTMARAAEARPSELSSVTFWHLGGAISRIDKGATAYRRRDAPYLFTAESSWDDAESTQRNIQWSRDALSAMRSYSHGGLYLNFAGFGEEKEAMLRDTYGPNYERLVQIKTTYDPTNLFHMNQNIKPLASPA